MRFQFHLVSASLLNFDKRGANLFGNIVFRAYFAERERWLGDKSGAARNGKGKIDIDWGEHGRVRGARSKQE